jgi:hypothetical protein
MHQAQALLVSGQTLSFFLIDIEYCHYRSVSLGADPELFLIDIESCHYPCTLDTKVVQCQITREELNVMLIPSCQILQLEAMAGWNGI